MNPYINSVNRGILIFLWMVQSWLESLLSFRGSFVCVTLVSFIEASSILKVENKTPPVFAPYVLVYHLEWIWRTENPGIDEQVPFVP